MPRPLLRVALGVLRWPPEAVWRATPREIAAAIAALRPERGPPLARTRLDELMAHHPDE
ncbi:phage tail assembly chaperone [Blastochloris viridis]|uniref:Phage tail assembly chaperone n=1 Tax=Blastochloris viridis TaxID=1079 RepID=A0A0H5BHT9_BLAVI|nr:phage tail assembly chaperone [Blastochloris viridis]ALK10120.1 hypothetical protein BVIR_2353 [Blastochloris viridis]BAR99951.1 hypothetical protein BV133_2358 [Blastochloris viridis]CUU42784.1 hypothetical protein BVIRIDIS_17990 [Blastochloris viridis]